MGSRMGVLVSRRDFRLKIPPWDASFNTKVGWTTIYRPDSNDYNQRRTPTRFPPDELPSRLGEPLCDTAFQSSFSLGEES